MMSERPPRPAATIRARSSRDTLVYLDVYRPGARAIVERSLPSDVLAAIEAPGNTGYVPLEADSRMGEAIVEYLGVEEASRFWVRYITHHLDAPFLASTVRAAISLFGATPSGLLRWSPKVLPMIFRDAFDMHVDLGESNDATLRFDVHSDVFLTSKAYPIVLEAMVRAIYVITEARGEVRVVRDTHARTFTVSATWRKAEVARDAAMS